MNQNGLLGDGTPLSLQDLLRTIMPQSDGDAGLPPPASPAVEQYQSGAGHVPQSYRAQGLVPTMPARDGGFWGKPDHVLDFRDRNFPPGVIGEVDTANDAKAQLDDQIRYLRMAMAGTNGPTRGNARYGGLPGPTSTYWPPR